MSFSYEYINRNEQPSYLEYSLLITISDEDGYNGEYRVEKSFIDKAIVDDAYLMTIANDDYLAIKNLIDQAIMDSTDGDN